MEKDRMIASITGFQLAQKVRQCLFNRMGIDTVLISAGEECGNFIYQVYPTVRLTNAQHSDAASFVSGFVACWKCFH